MKMRHAIFGVVLAASAFAAEKPNIIMIMSDDQGWGDVGFNGHPELKTPHLDAMAANGVRFDRFYAASPLCSPTRGSCLTGRYPFRYGIFAAHTAGMRIGEITVAELLKEEGYKTGFFGKWHTGWVKPELLETRGYYSPPDHHGYDEWFATTSAMPTWDPAITPKNWNAWGQKEGAPWKNGDAYMRNGKVVTENLMGDDSRVIMDRVIPFIEKNKGERFLATVWFHTPHVPVVADPEYVKMYAHVAGNKRHYYGCITAMDEQIGRLRAELRRMGLEKNTVLFFCSDNGPADNLTRQGIASAGPFRGHKHEIYEGGLLVPACAEWPGVIQPGTTTDVRCSTVDFLPTIAKLAGTKIKDERPIDGIDLMPIIHGERTERGKDLFFGFRRLFAGTDLTAIIRDDHKLVIAEEKGVREVALYDLENDPYETEDLKERMPERFEELKAGLAELDASCRLSHEGGDFRY